MWENNFNEQFCSEKGAYTFLKYTIHLLLTLSSRVVNRINIVAFFTAELLIKVVFPHKKCDFWFSSCGFIKIHVLKVLQTVHYMYLHINK